MIKRLENQSDMALAWLQNNKMIANPEKFHAIFLSKDKKDNSNLENRIGNKIINSEPIVKLLGVTIDHKLNFDLHVRKICKTASTQLNALFRFKHILPLKAKQILVQSFVYANFNYCPLVWHLSSAKSLLTVEIINKRAMRFFQDIDNNPNGNSEKNNNFMVVLRLRNLCVEIFKSLAKISPTYMNKIFLPESRTRPVRKQHINNLKTVSVKTSTFGINSIRF